MLLPQDIVECLKTNRYPLTAEGILNHLAAHGSNSDERYRLSVKISALLKDLCKEKKIVQFFAQRCKDYCYALPEWYVGTSLKMKHQEKVVKKEQTTRVAIVEDHSLFRQTLTKALKPVDFIELMAAIPDVKSLFKQCAAKSSAPDICLISSIGIMCDGKEEIQAIRSHYGTVKILVMPTYFTRDALIGMIYAGANGYLLRDSGTEELQNALFMMQQSGQYWDRLHHDVTLPDKERARYFPVINKTEQHFLSICITGANNEYIAEKIGLTLDTVKTYEKTLMKKLNVRTREDIILSCLKNNLLAPD